MTRPPTAKVGLPVWTWLVLAAALTYIADQLTKWLALRALGDSTVDLIGGWLVLRLSHNSGAALSWGSSITWVFTILALAISVGIVLLARRLVSRAWALTSGLLLGGALGNLTDRLARPPGFGRGAVVDFIGYGNFFIGNVADIAIVSAMVLLMIGAIRGVPLTAPLPNAGPQDQQAAAPEADRELGEVQGQTQDNSAEPVPPVDQSEPETPEDLDKPVAF